jgi:hypothetical protein
VATLEGNYETAAANTGEANENLSQAKAYWDAAANSSGQAEKCAESSANAIVAAVGETGLLEIDVDYLIGPGATAQDQQAAEDDAIKALGDLGGMVTTSGNTLAEQFVDAKNAQQLISLKAAVGGDIGLSEALKAAEGAAEAAGSPDSGQFDKLEAQQEDPGKGKYNKHDLETSNSIVEDSKVEVKRSEDLLKSGENAKNGADAGKSIACGFKDKIDKAGEGNVLTGNGIPYVIFNVNPDGSNSLIENDNTVQMAIFKTPHAGNGHPFEVLEDIAEGNGDWLPLLSNGHEPGEYIVRDNDNCGRVYVPYSGMTKWAKDEAYKEENLKKYEEYFGESAWEPSYANCDRMFPRFGVASTGQASSPDADKMIVTYSTEDAQDGKYTKLMTWALKDGVVASIDVAANLL